MSKTEVVLADKTDTSKDIVLAAIERGAPVDVIERVAALRERLDAVAARRAWQQALARAQAEMPVINRTRTARITSSRGAYAYEYTPIEDVVHVAGPVLTRHGFSWRWDYEFGDNSVTATCYLSHDCGHTEQSRFLCPITPGGNPAHAVASARTYATRYSFISVAGLVVGGEDDDAAAQTEEAATHDPDARTKILKTLMEARGIDHLRSLYRGLDRSERSVLTPTDIEAIKRTVEGRENLEHDQAQIAAHSHNDDPNPGALE